jgi:hypothetical protein
MGRPKLTLKELRERHGTEIDISDQYKRSRYARMLDAIYAAGIKLEDKNLDNIARGTARSAASDYLDRTGGKPTLAVEQTLSIVHKSAEEAAQSILEQLGQKKREAQQPQEPKNQTIQ